MKKYQVKIYPSFDTKQVIKGTYVARGYNQAIATAFKALGISTDSHYVYVDCNVIRGAL